MLSVKSSSNLYQISGGGCSASALQELDELLHELLHELKLDEQLLDELELSEDEQELELSS